MIVICPEDPATGSKRQFTGSCRFQTRSRSRMAGGKPLWPTRLTPAGKSFSVTARQVDKRLDDAEYETLMDAAVIALPGLEVGSGWSPTPRVPSTVMEIVSVFGPGIEPTESEISDAFDTGMGLIRSVLNAYIVVTKDPIRIPARESLPPVIPMVRRTASLDDDGFPGLLGAFLASSGSLRPTVMPDVSTEDWVQVKSLFRGDDPYPFATYLATRAAAIRSFERDGDYRNAILSAATACEVLLDDVLLHLFWQEALTPEQAARFFSDARVSVLKRSQTHLAPRLGGSWGALQDGPIRDWKENVANPRHRVVHGGFDPQWSDASDSIQSMFRLEAFVLERLCNAKTLTDFPHTALSMVGLRGLERRGLNSRALKERMGSWRGAASPHTLFDRWRHAVADVRLGAEQRLEPDSNGGSVVVVRRADGTRSWYVFDASTALVAPIADRWAELSPPATVNLLALLEDLDDREVENDVSINIEELLGGATEADWRLAYRHLPNHEVMFDGSDRSD